MHRATSHSKPNPRDAAHALEAKRLKQLARKRVPRAVEAIRLVGNLGIYQPAAIQIEAISGALRNAVEQAITRLNVGGMETFDLPDADEPGRKPANISHHRRNVA